MEAFLEVCKTLRVRWICNGNVFWLFTFAFAHFYVEMLHKPHFPFQNITLSINQHELTAKMRNFEEDQRGRLEKEELKRSMKGLKSIGGYRGVFLYIRRSFFLHESLCGLSDDRTKEKSPLENQANLKLKTSYILSKSLKKKRAHNISLFMQLSLEAKLNDFS